MELLLPWGLPWRACGPNLRNLELPTSQVPGNSAHPSAPNLLPDLGRPWPWPLGRTLVAWRLVQWIGGYCQCLGVISEDPIRNGRRTLSTSPVSQIQKSTLGKQRLFLRCTAPPICPPSTTLRVPRDPQNVCPVSPHQRESIWGQGETQCLT